MTEPIEPVVDLAKVNRRQDDEKMTLFIERAEKVQKQIIRLVILILGTIATIAYLGMQFVTSLVEIYTASPLFKK